MTRGVPLTRLRSGDYVVVTPLAVTESISRLFVSTTNFCVPR
jgi:hypothetical protein